MICNSFRCWLKLKYYATILLFLQINSSLFSEEIDHYFVYYKNPETWVTQKQKNCVISSSSFGEHIFQIFGQQFLTFCQIEYSSYETNDLIGTFLFVSSSLYNMYVINLESLSATFIWKQGSQFLWFRFSHNNFHLIQYSSRTFQTLVRDENVNCECRYDKSSHTTLYAPGSFICLIVMMIQSNQFFGFLFIKTSIFNLRSCIVQMELGQRCSKRQLPM